jgi:hypothetical protein
VRTNKLLDQDKVWVTRDGMPVTLEEMDPEHRKATLGFLRRRAVFLRRAYEFCEITDGLYGRRDHFDMGPEELDDDPTEWLERRPLVKELARLVRAEGAIDAEVVDAEVVPRELEHHDH